MSRIRVLPPEIYTRIAAGEVIERPANIVKELIENSIDANSTEITIEIIEAGKKLIRISDNGCGMTKEELLLSIKPHSTSKINKFEDVYNLNTLGFRGEALASIVNVSKTKITSKIENEKIAYELTVYGSEIISVKETSANKGTTVEIKDLFYNVPARLKFLKSNYTEKIHIIKTVEEYTIPYYNIHFKLICDNNLIFNLTQSDTILPRIKQIFKKEITNKLIFFETVKNDIQFYGFIAPFEYSQINKSLQFFYVNNRPVNSKILSDALYNAYREDIPTGRHPVGIVFLKLNPQNFDINIHPKKRLIKFKDENLIYQILRNTLQEKIKEHYRKSTKNVTSSDVYTTFVKEYTPELKIEKNLEVYQEKNLILPKTDLYSSLTQSLLENNKYEKIGLRNYTYLGQLKRTYLLFETNTSLILIDQHAASERILFEKLIHHDNYQSQKLLFPINIELRQSEFEALSPYLEQMNELGFDIAITGKSSFGFYAIPSLIKINDIKDFILKFIENLLSEIKDIDENVKTKDKIIRSACRSAIKANELLSISEVENLLDNLSKCEQPFICPHGRPIIVNIDISNIEKMFLRNK
ncbi:MAG: DNA mismatch repair endonuclease MutL [Endomicrobia bacterium]|nr:DNA mismatch repair endonuclease MutL [Endomicrobiia bacterium]